MENIHRIVNYLLDPEALNTDHTTPIWCLGKEYSPVPDPVESTPESHVHKQITTTTASAKAMFSNYFAKSTNGKSLSDEALINTLTETSRKPVTAWPASFIDCVQRKLYMTYRTDFPMIPRAASGPATLSMGSLLRGQINDRAGFTSDVGWGCMVRSGQTLLANAFALLYNADVGSEKEKEIISWFADDPQAQFSLHNFVYHGRMACGKYPGEWFGPSATARCTQILCADFKQSTLRVYIGGDSGDVYEDSVWRVAGGEDQFQATLILLGIRLGIEKITSVYYDALKYALRLPQSVGIAGGRPMSSHYFFGYQGSMFFYLDPHIHRRALPFKADISTYTDEELNSVHTTRVRSITLDAMDPSMLIGFLVKDRDDWVNWKEAVAKFKGRQFIHIYQSEPSFGPTGLDDSHQMPSFEVNSDDPEEFEIDRDLDSPDVVVALDDDGEESLPYEEDDTEDRDFDKCGI
ncbi:hypothetical protein V1512DRAFT_249118 [Lipomyces arxii]|uniref:uncharacterized protein n=1 Tax=Lipomyces arxii TaxID=56418 RepID=UPI0034CD90DD